MNYVTFGSVRKTRSVSRSDTLMTAQATPRVPRDNSTTCRDERDRQTDRQSKNLNPEYFRKKNYKNLNPESVLTWRGVLEISRILSVRKKKLKNLNLDFFSSIKMPGQCTPQGIRANVPAGPRVLRTKEEGHATRRRRRNTSVRRTSVLSSVADHVRRAGAVHAAGCGVVFGRGDRWWRQ